MNTLKIFSPKTLTTEYFDSILLSIISTFILACFLTTDKFTCFQDEVRVKAKDHQQSRMDLLALTNDRHCSATPIYGSDLINSMKINVSTKSPILFTAALSHQYSRKDMGTCLCNIIKLPKHRVKERKGITSRYTNMLLISLLSISFQKKT